MKRLFLGALALILSIAASATTLNPVQLLNPAGSASGQAPVSTGPTTAPAWGNVPATALASQAANTVVANVTGSAASPTAFAMPSCTGSTNALGYTYGTGIVCNSSINAATLGGATFAAPGAIGGTTPGSGAFTTLSASSTVSGSGFSTYLASPPAIGGTAAAAGAFTTLSAGANDALTYNNASAQSIPNNAVTAITTWTKIYDRVNSNFNASTGIFTAPATGYYQVSGGIGFVSGTAQSTTNETYQLCIFVNGSTNAACGANFNESTIGVSIAVSVNAIISLTSGQTIQLRVLQTSGAALAILSGGASVYNYLSITRIP